MPKAPSVQQGKVVQQPQARPTKELPPLALAALGEYLARYPSTFHLEDAARRLPKEALQATLTPTDDPGNWLEEQLRQACIPEELNAAGAEPKVTEHSHGRPYADFITATQNAMRAAVSLVTPQRHGFAVIGKLELSSGWAQLLLAGAQLQVASWVATPDLRGYIVQAVVSCFGENQSLFPMLSGALLPLKSMQMWQKELAGSAELHRHHREMVVELHEVGLLVPLIAKLPKTRQAALVVDVLTGLLVPEGPLPPDTLWHWAAYQQLVQYGLLAPITEAAGARTSDIAVAWQGVAKEMVAAKEKDQTKWVPKAKNALSVALHSLLAHSQEQRKLSEACVQRCIKEARQQSAQAGPAAGRWGPGGASSPDPSGASSSSSSSNRNGRPVASRQPQVDAGSSHDPFHAPGLSVQQQQVLLPAVKAFLRASGAETEDSRGSQQQQQQPPLHTLLVLQALQVGRRSAADLHRIIWSQYAADAGTAADAAAQTASSSCNGEPCTAEEGDCPAPAMCRARQRIAQHAAAHAACMSAVCEATTGQKRGQQQQQQQQRHHLLLAVLSPSSPQALLAAAGLQWEEVDGMQPAEGMCQGLPLSAAQRVQVDVLVDAHFASLRLADVMDQLGASLLSQHVAQDLALLTSQQQQVVPSQQLQQQQQHQLGCMLQLCNQAELLHLHCDLCTLYNSVEEALINDVIAIDLQHSSNSSSATAATSTSKPVPTAAVAAAAAVAAGVKQQARCDSPARAASCQGRRLQGINTQRCTAAGSTGGTSRHSSVTSSPTAAAAAERPGPSLRVAALRAAASVAREARAVPGPAAASSSHGHEARPPGRRKGLVVEAAEDSGVLGKGHGHSNGSALPFSPRSDASFHTASDDESVRDGDDTPAAAAKGAGTRNPLQAERAAAAAQKLGQQRWAEVATLLCNQLLCLDAAAVALQHSLAHPQAAASSSDPLRSNGSRGEGQAGSSPSTWGSLGSMLGWMGGKGASSTTTTSSSSSSSSRPPSTEPSGPRLPKQRAQEQREAWEQQKQQWRTAVWRRYGEVRPQGRARFDNYFGVAGPQVEHHKFWVLAAAVLRADLRHVAAHRLCEDLLSLGARMDLQDWPGTGAEEALLKTRDQLEPPLQEMFHLPDRQLNAPLGGLDIQVVQLVRGAWRDMVLQAAHDSPAQVAQEVATSVLRLQLLLGQLSTRYTPVTFPWHASASRAGGRSYDKDRMMERAREATASPGLMGAGEELRLLVKALFGIKEFLDDRSATIKLKTQSIQDQLKKGGSSSRGTLDPEQHVGAYGRTLYGDHPAHMFTICQAWLLLELRRRGLAEADLGGRLQAVGSVMSSLAWLSYYNAALGPKPPLGCVDLLHMLHTEPGEGLQAVVGGWAQGHPLLFSSPYDDARWLQPTCDTCGKRIRLDATPDGEIEEVQRLLEVSPEGPQLCGGCGVARWCSRACAERSRHGRFCWEVLSRSLQYNDSSLDPEAAAALQEGQPGLVALCIKDQGLLFGGAPQAEFMASSHRSPGPMPSIHNYSRYGCNCPLPHSGCPQAWLNTALENWTGQVLSAAAEEEAAPAQEEGQGVEDLLQLHNLSSWRPVGQDGARGYMNELD